MNRPRTGYVKQPRKRSRSKNQNPPALAVGEIQEVITTNTALPAEHLLGYESYEEY